MPPGKGLSEGVSNLSQKLGTSSGLGEEESWRKFPSKDKLLREESEYHLETLRKNF